MQIAPDIIGERILPHGRSFREYSFMFSIQPVDHGKRILSVGDGVSSFNAEGAAAGWNIVSIDPLYALSPQRISGKLAEVFDRMVRVACLFPQHWTWTLYPSRESLIYERQRVKEQFILHFATERATGRYVAGSLPILPFADDAFDMAVCSHLLFSWSDMLDAAFHFVSVEEMLRVSKQVRIFPTRDMHHQMFKYVNLVLLEFRGKGYSAELRPTNCRSPIGSFEQLVITRH